MCSEIRGSLRVFVVIVAQLVTQRCHWSYLSDFQGIARAVDLTVLAYLRPVSTDRIQGGCRLVSSVADLRRPASHNGQQDFAMLVQGEALALE
jgi:hypothetical protein